MKYRVDGQGLFSSRQYDTLEEARSNLYDKKGRKGNITVETAEDEYLRILKLENYSAQKIISLQQELESVQTLNTKLTSEISNLKQQLSLAENKIAAVKQSLSNEQEKTARLENHINSLDKFIPGSKINTVKDVVYNPYECGVAFQRLTPAPKDKLKTVELTERSQILMNHITNCSAVTSLAVERLIGCGRKSARAILKKMWFGGYLECVECLTKAGRFKLYYLPGSNIKINTANEVCHLAVLSLVYANCASNINRFRNLSFEIIKRHRKHSKGAIDLGIYVAFLSFVRTEKQDQKVIEKSYKFTVIPFRKNEKMQDIVFFGGTELYILPLKNLEDAEKIVERGCAYTIDDYLIKNNLLKNIYLKN